MKKFKQGASLHDIVVLTGVSTDWVEFTIRILLEEYSCRLKVNDKNELLYLFDFSKQRYNNFNKVKSFFRLQKRKNHLFTEKIILNYIRNNQGKLVVAELIQLTGWSVYQAETQATRLLAQYQGEVKISKEGVIVYTFEDIEKLSTESEKIKESLKIWERPESEKTFDIESWKAKFNKINRFNILTYFTGFLVIMSLIFGRQGGVLSNLLLIVSGITLLFSGTFYFIPVFKSILIELKNQKIRTKNAETFLLKGIFKRIDQNIYPEKDIKRMIFEAKPVQSYLYWWNKYISPAFFENTFILTSSYHRELLLEKKAIELEANIAVDNKGKIYYQFERLQRELNVIERLKNNS